MIRATEPDTCCGDLNCAPMPYLGIRFIGTSDTLDLAVFSGCMAWSFLRKGKYLGGCTWLPHKKAAALMGIVDAMTTGARNRADTGKR